MAKLETKLTSITLFGVINGIVAINAPLLLYYRLFDVLLIITFL